MLSLPIILGPTGIGKTEIGIKVAEQINAEIVSCDSMQVYKYMDIGTVKPTKEEQNRIKHYMIDIIDPDEDYNAWAYAKQARKIIKDIYKNGKIPLVVGGSGLYLKALIQGFFDTECTEIATENTEIRERLSKETADVLYNRLLNIDRKRALKLHKNDRKRIIRAIEVYELTGVPMSLLERERAPFNCRPIYIGLFTSRELLYKKINERVEKMIESGFVEEVKWLLEKGYSPVLNSLNGLGYKELITYINGEISLNEAIRLIKRNTRRYAKRQMTWFKKMEEVYWIELPNKNIIEKISGYITCQYTKSL